MTTSTLTYKYVTLSHGKTRLTTAPVVRQIINPIGHQVQINGTIMQGIGYTLVAPPIANAVADAIGVRIRDLPITAEKVCRPLSADALRSLAVAPTAYRTGGG